MISLIPPARIQVPATKNLLQAGLPEAVSGSGLDVGPLLGSPLGISMGWRRRESNTGQREKLACDQSLWSLRRFHGQLRGSPQPKQCQERLAGHILAARD